MTAGLRTRLGLKARAWLAEVLPEGDALCCTCGSMPPVYEYQDACTNRGWWDWAQCQGCHDGTDDHARWMRTLKHRRIEVA